MTSLVLELQKDALNSSNNLTDLLRKALVVAKKLGIKDFQDWINYELNGYDSDDKIPQYRVVSGQIKALNPYHGWIPCSIPDNNLACQLKERAIIQSIGALVSLLKNNESGFLQAPFPPEDEHVLRSLFQVRFQIALHIDPSVLYGILDTVRNTVLEWSLKLEQEGILGKGMSFSEDEKEKALKNQNVRIENFQGIFGNVSDSNVTQNLEMSIKPGDYKILADYLKKNKVSNEDISELQIALEKDSKPESADVFGDNVSSWIGKMSEKAASGAWQISITSASNILASAIKAYYGFKN